MCFFAISSITITSQGLPYTWVAKIAEVFLVIEASIFVASIFNESLFISTKTGEQFSQTIELVVATNEKGVVIISPFKSNAFIAICSAIVPFVKKSKFCTFKCFLSFSSNSLAKGPIFVSHPVSHILEIKASYSSFGGKNGFVTGIIKYFISLLNNYNNLLLNHVFSLEFLL